MENQNNQSSITIRIDEELKKDLQELLSNLGMDMTTFFVMAAKQAVREQAVPFQITLNTSDKVSEDNKIRDYVK